jgi:hypothetical protein
LLLLASETYTVFCYVTCFQKPPEASLFPLSEDEIPG